MSNTVNKTLLATILRKRQNSEPLNNEEEAYARKIFDQMMDSKKQVRKVVRIVTGEQLRKESKLEKAKTDAEPTRKDPRYTEGKNPQKIKAENTDPDVDSLKMKIPDADLKPKTGPHPGLEQDRVSSMTQEAVPPRSEAVKFTSADPVKAGDIVSKNMMREGTRIVKGVVLKVKDGVAFVKWGDGRTMYEPAHLLVKVKKSDAAVAADDVNDDPKLGPSEKDEETYNVPITKQAPRRRARQVAASARSTGREVGRTAVSRAAASPVGRRVVAAASRAGRRVGQAVTGAARGVRQAAGRVAAGHKRRRAISAPARHARRAIGPGSYLRAPAEAARSIGRAIQSLPAARQARREQRDQSRKKMQKDGDLAEAPDYSTSRPKTTPFQDLTSSLQDVVRLAGDLKGKAENTKDEDVKNEYEKLIGQLRGIAETILSGLNSELEEAKAENDTE